MSVVGFRSWMHRKAKNKGVGPNVCCWLAISVRKDYLPWGACSVHSSLWNRAAAQSREQALGWNLCVGFPDSPTRGTLYPKAPWTFTVPHPCLLALVPSCPIWQEVHKGIFCEQGLKPQTATYGKCHWPFEVKWDRPASSLWALTCSKYLGLGVWPMWILERKF